MDGDPQHHVASRGFQQGLACSKHALNSLSSVSEDLL